MRALILILACLVSAWMGLPHSVAGRSLAQQNEQIEQWIDKLKSDQFRERELASRQLAAFGLQAAPYLVEQITQGDPESAVRSADILETIGLNSDENDAIRVARIFRLLAAGGRHDLLSRSAEMRALWKQRRIERTVKQLEQLGATVHQSNANQFFVDSFPGQTVVDEQPSDTNPVAEAKDGDRISTAEILSLVDSILQASDEDNLAQFDAEMSAESETATSETETADQAILRSGIRLEGRAMIVAGGDVFFTNSANQMATFNVTIDDRWQGTPDQLKLLTYLPSVSVLTIANREVTPEWFAVLAKLESLQVLYLNQSTYDLTSTLDFLRLQPSLNMQVEGTAFLGVTAENAIYPETEQPCCRIQSVVPLSGAAEAELQARDLILSVDEVAVDTFQQLVVTIATYQPGDQIRLKIVRDDEPLELTATLGTKPGVLPVPPRIEDDPFDDD